ncbi:MAG TPA: hypothetical protein VFO25_08455 [Candidatus Eremiobacteraceae bacterium]|nr:hypothetical protein [Candidatus Eremiobacteraceae bacterium]
MCIAVACVLFAHTSVLAALEQGLVGPWPGFGETLVTAAISAVGGAVLGILRYFFKLRNGVVTELIATAAAPDVITSGRLGVAAVGFQLTLGFFGGIVAAHLGATPFAPDVHTAVLGVLAGAGGPPADAGSASVWALLIALTAVIVGLTILFAFGEAAVLIVVAKALATGAISGGGRATGELLVLMLTRVWTVQLRDIAKTVPPGRLTPGEAMERYLSLDANTEHREAARLWLAQFQPWFEGPESVASPDEPFSPVLRYLKRSPRWQEYQDFLAHYESLPKYKRYSAEWTAQHDARWHLRQLSDVANDEKAELEKFVEAVREMKEARDPAKRMKPVGDAPVYDGSYGSLFYVGVIKAAIANAIASGAYGGAVTAIIACFFLALAKM